MKARYSILALLTLLVMLISACAAPAPATQAPAAAPTKAPEATKAPEPTKAPAPTAAPAAAVKDFVSWYQYDQNNEDPKADERVGNAWLRTHIPMFNKAFAGKWNWVNQPKAFDKMDEEIILAVQAGGDVPDLHEMGSEEVIQYASTGTMQDLTEWAKTRPWYKDLHESAIKECTDPSGKMVCIPVVERPHLVYVWKDRFPNGFPKTPEQFLTEAERLKKEGHYAMTFFGSTDFGGDATTRAYWTIISSFGGTYDDGNGKLKLNTPENIAAIEFLRKIVQEGYVPDIAFAGKFQEEEAFKDSSAGSFPTGLFGYRYVNPLTAPSGKKYEKKNAEDMLDAIAAGDVVLSQMFAPAGKTPSCGIEVYGFGIPVGAKNIEAAHDYIDWIMSPEINPSYVLEVGSGFPTQKSMANLEAFKAPFYQQAANAINNSACRRWFGTLTRPEEAQPLLANVIYKLVKEDPKADIATELTKVEKEYNAGE